MTSRWRKFLSFLSGSGPSNGPFRAAPPVSNPAEARVTSGPRGRHPSSGLPGAGSRPPLHPADEDPELITLAGYQLPLPLLRIVAWSGLVVSGALFFAHVLQPRDRHWQHPVRVQGRYISVNQDLRDDSPLLKFVSTGDTLELTGLELPTSANSIAWARVTQNLAQGNFEAKVPFGNIQQRYLLIPDSTRRRFQAR